MEYKLEERRLVSGESPYNEESAIIRHNKEVETKEWDELEWYKVSACIGKECQSTYRWSDWWLKKNRIGYIALKFKNKGICKG